MNLVEATLFFSSLFNLFLIRKDSERIKKMVFKEAPRNGIDIAIYFSMHLLWILQFYTLWKVMGTSQ